MAIGKTETERQIVYVDLRMVTPPLTGWLIGAQDELHHYCGGVDPTNS